MMAVILLSQVYAFQNDWSGGPGVQGPVAAWGNRFWQSQNVNYSNPGILSLIVILLAPGNWQKRTIDLGGVRLYQGFSPFDIDGDGDKDLVLLSNNVVRWYEFIGNWTYIPHDVINIPGLTTEGCAMVWPDDFDRDGDGDLIVADGGGGLYFLRNNGATWTSTTLTTRSTTFVLSADIDQDGDRDFFASSRAVAAWPNTDTSGVWWWENTDGNGNFIRHPIWTFRTLDLPVQNYQMSWRLAVGDLNGDLWPDVVSTPGGTLDGSQYGDGMAHVFLNNRDGTFTHNWYPVNPGPGRLDGMWLNDLDRDGDLDITIGRQDFANSWFWFEALINDGTGLGFTYRRIIDPAVGYTDGAIAYDMDLDGLVDVVGAYQRIGYFKSSVPFPNYTEYQIDPNFQDSHWVYPDDLDQLSCTPDLDILATRGGEHAVYENKMNSLFASSGWLESSILQLHAVADSGGAISWFGWGYNTCIPNDTAVALFWRAGNTVAEILAAPWVGPIFLREGTGADSVFLGTPCKKYFQYRIELRADQVNREIATQGGVWIKYTSCPLYEKVEETKPMPSVFRMNQRGDALVLELPGPTTARLSLYDATGRLLSVIHEGDMGPGVFEFRPSVPAGIYMAVYKAKERTATVKFLVGK
ncbi:MAG: T9SS type A sorting domain-containing protein [candidate division WOR-3 bacterium]